MGPVGRGRGQTLTGDREQEAQATAGLSIPPESSGLLSGKPWVKEMDPFLPSYEVGLRGLQHPGGKYWAAKANSTEGSRPAGHQAEDGT